MLMPVFLVVALGLVWSAYWWVASGIARDRVASERRNLAADGVEVACETETWGGYPFRFEFSCTNPVITLRGGAEVRSQAALAVALAYKPWHIIALIDGPTHVTLPGQPAHVVEHGRMTASLQIGADQHFTASAELPGVRSATFGSFSRSMAHLRPAADNSWDVAVSIRGLELVTAAADPLRIDEASFTGTLGADRQLAVDKIDLRRHDVALWGTGTVSLDQAHRLEGRIAAETNTLTGLMALIEPQLQMDEAQSANLALMLGVLGETPKVDLVAQDGAFYIGPIRIGDLAPLF